MFAWPGAADDAVEPTEVYPARVKWRGFTPEVEREGFDKITKYMREQGDKLHAEVVGDEQLWL